MEMVERQDHQDVADTIAVKQEDRRKDWTLKARRIVAETMLIEIGRYSR